MRRMALHIILFGVVVAGMACAAAQRFSFGGNGPASSPSPGEARAYGPQSQEDFNWRGSVAPGGVIEIKGVNGSIRAALSPGDEVEVSATKRGRRADPGSVKIEVLKHANGVTICALYPSDDPSQPNDCQPGRAGRVNAQRSDVTVDFTVRVPPGVRFAGRTVNGEIEVISLKGDVEAYTVNGSIRVSTSTHAQARTVNGTINASLGDTMWENALEFETVNGSITVELPKGANTEVRAETFGGSVSTDFPLIVQKRSMAGTIGSGRRVLKIRSHNGNIHLRELS